MDQINKADVHIHTTFSDGLNEPEVIVNYAGTNTDLRIIAITDHNTIDGARAAYNYWQKHRAGLNGLEVIVGAEISSADGQILGLFLQENVPRNMSSAKTVAAIHEQGGLAIAPHPFARWWPFNDFNGVGRLIGELSLDGVDERSSMPLDIFSNVITAVYNQSHAQHATLGSSNAHYLTMIGKTHTLFPGKTAADFRQAVANKQVRAGGQVNGFAAGAQILLHLLRRRQQPAALHKDCRHRHKHFGLTIDVLEERWGPLAVMRCTGDLVVGNSDLLQEQGQHLLAAGFTYLLIDLAGIQFLDSSGIGALITLHCRAHQAGGDLFLTGLNKGVALTLQLVRQDKYFHVFNSMENGLAAFTESSPTAAAG